jgi:hypothetical protein
MAMTKFFWRFLKRKLLAIATAHKYDTKVCTRKMKGMMARSTSFSAVNWEASLVKTITSVNRNQGALKGGTLLKQGVKSITFRLARNFCDSASNMPCLATM